MGLDQYAYYVDERLLNCVRDVDFDYDRLISGEVAGALEPKEFFYWRKHPGLQGWMHDLYDLKGGSSQDFNGNPVRLDEVDLDALEDAVKSGRLPETSGFFFGQNRHDEYTDEKDLDFIRQARDFIRNGYAVFYDSSW